jgi:leader peptidase (prepilin peptidase) / N-methyltransferase
MALSVSLAMFPQTVALTLLMFLCAILMVLATIDACYGIIPDWANAAVALTGLAHAGLGFGPSIYQAVFAALIMFMIVFLLHEAFVLWRGRPGIGMGDVKFLAAAATWTGLAGLPTLLLIASVSGLLFLIIRSFAGIPINTHTRLAFGPHLAGGLAFVSLFGSLN